MLSVSVLTFLSFECPVILNFYGYVGILMKTILYNISVSDLWLNN